MSSTPQTNLVLGEDWVSPQAISDNELRGKQAQRGRITVKRSPLARKIIVFNLIGLVVLVAGVLFLNPFRDSLLLQRQRELVAEAELIAQMLSVQKADASDATVAQVPQNMEQRFVSRLESIILPSGIEVFVYDLNGKKLAHALPTTRPLPAKLEELQSKNDSTLITDALRRAWDFVSDIVSSRTSSLPTETVDQVMTRILPLAKSGSTHVEHSDNVGGASMFAVATPIMVGQEAGATLAIISGAGELDTAILSERETLLQMFVLAMVVSITLSLILASTIANPLSQLAAAAELGRSKTGKDGRTGRVRIPDLTGRPDEIGRLSGALRGMVTALYDRIDANEQFAADVAHEIKNPLASLRSAIGTLRLAQRDAQREKLLDVIDHDVRRLDRLVSDISNASRLDSELVKEEEETFELLHMLKNITDHLTLEATKVGIDFVTDMPDGPIEVAGLEARLAQVFVNLITNALSFCEDGDAIRVWARRRENRVLVVVEDTGPGIPDQALTKVFDRFYSERPEHQFGNNSGLGLAISKQIVEAHGGVIWAENIRPTDADLSSEPLGARFVVGLPL